MGVRIVFIGIIFILVTSSFCVGAFQKECGCGNLVIIEDETEPQNKKYALGLIVENKLDDPWLPEPISLSGAPPNSWDWRNVNGIDWVTEVKDQDNCGSCYAFAVTAAMETVYNIQKNDPNIDLDLSEQFILSCSMSPPWNNKGCCYGFIGGTLSFLKTEGVPSENCFPYNATDANGRDAGDCPDRTPSHDPVLCSDACPEWQIEAIKIIEYNSLSSAEDMKIAISTYGPIVATFTVYSDFPWYSGGIYKHKWGNVEGSHAVAIVGYDDTHEYWICKNSWGNWGEDGYFRIAYGECTIDSPGNVCIKSCLSSRSYCKPIFYEILAKMPMLHLLLKYIFKV